MMDGLARTVVALLVALALAGAARVDTVNARCDIHPGGQSRASASVPCTLSRRQGYVAIQLADGTRHKLSQKGDQPGTYVDAKRRPAYRNGGLGSSGPIYHLGDQSIYVHWEVSAALAAKPAARGYMGHDDFAVVEYSRKPAARAASPGQLPACRSS